MSAYGRIGTTCPRNTRRTPNSGCGTRWATKVDVPSSPSMQRALPGSASFRSTASRSPARSHAESERPDRVGATSAYRRTDALGEAPDPLIELRGRERAEGQPEEPLAASTREEGEAVGEVQPARGGRRADRRGARSGREREGDEEAAVGADRIGVGHLPVDRREAGREARRVERLQAGDLRFEESLPAPLEG